MPILNMLNNHIYLGQYPNTYVWVHCESGGSALTKTNYNEEEENTEMLLKMGMEAWSLTR